MGHLTALLTDVRKHAPRKSQPFDHLSKADMWAFHGNLHFCYREIPMPDVDQTDIDMALEAAQELEDDGLSTVANCIRACARTAQEALDNYEPLEDGECFRGGEAAAYEAEQMARIQRELK